MPTLRIVYDVAGWAYHNRALALQERAPADFEVSIVASGRRADPAACLGEREADLVFGLSTPELPAIARGIRSRGWRSKVLGSWNSGWPLQIPQFCTAYREADAVVINNRTAWERVGRLPRTFMLPNGVDLDLFRVVAPLEERKPKVLWTGSLLGRRRKGYDDFIVPLQQILQRHGIECETLLVDSYGDDKRGRRQMAEWYNTGTVLVCASAGEGTPNPALEAAACGCTVVSTAVGNMPELIRHGVNGYLVERDVDALVEAVRAACRNHASLATEMQRDIAAWGWDARSPAFYSAFREVLHGEGRTPIERPDLSDKVTVFVTTVGAPSFEPCLAQLREQDCSFEQQIIDHVAPMSAAFQRMLDGCTTPFFVQVDEDMLLYPHAVRTLCEAMSRADPDVALLFADLHDAHLDRPILGVKIYRHAVVRRYPFADVQSFEKLQVEQLEADGYRIAAAPRDGDGRALVLGLHGTHWTPKSIFERYAALESRRRRHPRAMRWFEEYHAVFLRRFLLDPSELNFYALLGTVSGAMLEMDRVGDKDFRTYDALPGLEAARRLYEALRVVPARAAPQTSDDGAAARSPSEPSVAGAALANDKSVKDPA